MPKGQKRVHGDEDRGDDENQYAAFDGGASFVSPWPFLVPQIDVWLTTAPATLERAKAHEQADDRDRREVHERARVDEDRVANDWYRA